MFYPGQRLFFKKPQLSQALHSINLQLQHGEILAIVGESGSGKSTLGMSIVGLVNDISGKYIYTNTMYDPSNMSDLRKEIQIIFQDALSSLNPRMHIGSAIEESSNFIIRKQILNNGCRNYLIKLTCRHIQKENTPMNCPEASGSVLA